MIALTSPVRAASPGRRAGGVLLAFVLLAGSGSACGKKGPPLAPVVRLPGPVQAFSARRLGDAVLVQFTIPTKNQDNSTPADIASVEVYGFTGAAPANDDLIKYGTLVASVPVRRPPPPEEKKPADTKKRPEKKPPDATKPKDAAPPVEAGYDQGAVVVVSETLTSALLQPVVIKPKRGAPRPAVEPAPPVFPPTASLNEMPTRVYVAVGVSRKGRRGAFSPRLFVPAMAAPLPPGTPAFTYDQTTLTIAWPPPPDAPAPTAVPAVPAPDELPVPPSRSLAPLISPVPTYDVYAVPVPPETPTSSEPGPLAIPTPLNPSPLAVPTFAIPVELGAQRCFAIRTVRTLGRVTIAGAPSPVGCVNARDTFPPAAPKGLSAVVGAGELSLAWEPNTERDLAGYLVLRGEASGGPLQPLTKAPIPETNYEDKTVKPGVRYVYAIVAVDTSGNLSAQSNRIEETAR